MLRLDSGTTKPMFCKTHMKTPPMESFLVKLNASECILAKQKCKKPTTFVRKLPMWTVTANVDSQKLLTVVPSQESVPIFIL